MGILTSARPAPAGHAASFLRLAAAAVLSVPLSLAGAHAATATAVHPAGASTNARSQTTNALARLPMRFEPATGHSFVALGPKSQLAISARGAVLTLSRAQADHRTANKRVAQSASVGMTFLGADAGASLIATDRLPGRSNYFLGSDPRAWRTGVAGYGQLRVSGLYPGIDLSYHGAGQRLEYDFALAPNADPARIRIAFSGARSLALDRHGNLLIRLPGGTLQQQAPVIYQSGGHGRQAVAGRFVLLGHNTVGFQLGRYDTHLPLTIDPVVPYGTYLGGTADELGYSVATDGQGNIYLDGVASTFAGGTPLTGTLPYPAPSLEAVFIAKLTPNGAGAADLAYLDYIGGTNGDTFLSDGLGWGYSLALDGAGNAYVAGSTLASNFPATPKAIQTSLNQGATTGAPDAFLATVNAAGSAIRYATLLGGSDTDIGSGVTVDGAGNAFVTGISLSLSGGTPFPTTNGTTPNENAAFGYSDIFVAKVVPNAALSTSAQLPYSTLLGGSYDDSSSAIALDHSGNILITGTTSSPDFPGTAGGYQPTNLSGGVVSETGIVAKLNLTASTANTPAQLVAATYLGGAIGNTFLFGLGVDAANNVDVAGYSYNQAYPTTPTAFDPTFLAPGGEVGVVSQLNPTLSTLRYSTYFGPIAGGGDHLDIYALAVDLTGTIYITGHTENPITTTSGAFALGGNGAFVAELIPDGTLTPTQQLAFSTLISGSSSDFGYGIAVDANGIVYLAGQYTSSDGLLPFTTGAFQPTFGGGSSDAFALKFLPTPEVAPRCIVQVTFLHTASAARLGLVAAARPAGGPSYPIAYITHQIGINTFVVRAPLTVSCIRPGLGTAIATVSGTISGPTKGPRFHVGDTVTVTVSLNPTIALVGSPTVRVVDPTATPPYDTTFSAPFTFPSVFRILAQ